MMAKTRIWYWQINIGLPEKNKGDGGGGGDGRLYESWNLGTSLAEGSNMRNLTLGLHKHKLHSETAFSVAV